MHQRRICEYLGLTCTHNRTFLCLPPTVRLQIYEEAGLGIYRDDMIDLNSRLEKSPFAKTPDESIINLLPTCRAIYTELASILYSSNKVFIRYQDTGNLQSLKILSSTALTAMRHLTVQLNMTITKPDTVCCPTYTADPRRRSKPFKASCRQHQEALAEWESVANYVLANCQLSNLCLEFICDVDDIESAERAVKPLLSIKSALAQCHVRLGRSPNPDLQALAKYVADNATRTHLNPSSSPFRFMELPVELQIQILNYTDLITPSLEVEWCPTRRFGLQYARIACPGYKGWDCCTPELHNNFQFRHCRYNVGNKYDLCFCYRRHAAYSSACHCWIPPTSLFLTSRTFRDLAMEVFFSENRFVITPPEYCDTPAIYTPEDLEAFIFFAHAVPRNALRFLRFVEIVFPPFKNDYLRANEPAYQEWLQTVTLMKSELNLPGLTLRVYMASIGAFDRHWGLPDYRHRITKEQGDTILQMYKRTLEPLAELDGLGKFFVHLNWPFARMEDTKGQLQTEPGFVYEHTKRINQNYEKTVMGDSYDSFALKEPRVSQWLERLSHNPFSE
jgi:hypothetical protein